MSEVSPPGSPNSPVGPPHGVAFRDFMRHALYHPTTGYYSARIKSVGRSGDFSTAPTLSRLPGLALAHWIKAEARRLAWKRVPIIEIGAGDGSLAKSILQSTGWLTRHRLDYGIVEISPVLRQRQKERLGKSVTWFDSVEDALAVHQGRALLIGNELVDAFPCDVLRKSDDGWDELFLQLQAGHWKETWLPWKGDATPFSAIREPWPSGLAIGQRIELHGSFRDWVRQSLAAWKEGSAWWCDYGADFPGLYQGRPHGTVRAYFQQERYQGPDVYERRGWQDITADVNFTDLREWGEALGWKTIAHTSLGEFLASAGKGKMTDTEARLCSNSDAGGAFRVLIQRKAGG